MYDECAKKLDNLPFLKQIVVLIIYGAILIMLKPATHFASYTAGEYRLSGALTTHRL